MSQFILKLIKLLSNGLISSKILSNPVRGILFAAKKEPQLFQEMIELYCCRKCNGSTVLRFILDIPKNIELISLCTVPEASQYLLRQSIYHPEIPLDLLVADSLNYYRYDIQRDIYMATCLQTIANNTARVKGGMEIKKSLTEIYSSYNKKSSEETIQDTFEKLESLGITFEE